MRHSQHPPLQTKNGVLGVYIDAVPELIHGELKQWADVAKVEPIRLPGYWIHKKGTSLVMGEKPSKDEKVVLFLHGGSYTSSSAHPSAPTSNVPRTILKECERIKRTLAVEYRLSAGAPLPAANPFPTALIDALAGYNYLVNTVGFVPENIIVTGDSAGGNLALALTRYLVEYTPQLSPALTTHPSPRALLLFSPWSDMSVATHSNPNSSIHTLAKIDYLVGPSCRPTPLPHENYAARAFVGPHGFDTAPFVNPYISPTSPDIPEGKGSFIGFPKTLVIAGNSELLVDQIRVLVERMEKDLGRDSGMVRYLEAKDAVHDFFVFPWFDSGRKEATEELRNWVASL